MSTAAAAQQTEEQQQQAEVSIPQPVLQTGVVKCTWCTVPTKKCTGCKGKGYRYPTASRATIAILQFDNKTPDTSDQNLINNIWGLFQTIPSQDALVSLFMQFA